MVYDAAYSTDNFTPQIDVYELKPIPATDEDFSNSLDITVHWNDARMSNSSDSTIRINARYPQICS